MEQAISEYIAMRAYETSEMNLERRRIFFLVLNITGNMNEATTYANVNINMKYLKCKYRPEVMKKLETYLAFR